jgi:hypothetical protein
MPPALERGNARLTTIQGVDSVVTVRDFVYEASPSAFDATASTTSNGMNTPFSESISGPSTTTVAAPALGIVTQDPNRLPYTTFYDASWTLLKNQFKPSNAAATFLPSVLAYMNTPLMPPSITAQNASAHRISDRSLTSEYSQYSTPSPISKYHYRRQSLPYRPMPTLVSDMEVQVLKDGSVPEGAKAVVVVDQVPRTASGNIRHESSGTTSSRQYSQYSTP